MRDFSANLTPGSARAAVLPLSDIVARLVEAPTEITRLSAGQFLRGQVVGQDDSGLLLIQTKLAILKLAAARSLAVGSEVILQLRPNGPPAAVTLIPLEGGQPLPAPSSDQPAAASLGRGNAVAGLQAALPPALTADQIAKAPLLRAVLQSTPPLPLLAGLPSAEPGTELLIRVLSLGALAQTGSSGPAPASPGATPPGAASLGTPLPGQSAQTPAGVAQPNSATPAGGAPGKATVPPAPGAGPGTGASPTLGAAQARTLTAAPNSLTKGAATLPPTPSGAPPATEGPQTGQHFAPQSTVTTAGHKAATALQSLSSQGAVEALARTVASGDIDPVANSLGDGRSLRVNALLMTPGGKGPAILHTPLGNFTLKTSIELPVGSSLALEVLLPTDSRSAALPTGLTAAWPGLETIEEALLSQLPSGQAEALQRALPQVGPRLSSGILFFLSAINQGNPLTWLAGPAAALERGERSDFLERLGREIVGLSRSVETSTGEWRLIHLPVWSDEGLRDIRLFLRQQGEQRDEAGETPGDKATRFVLELELKRHGALQLDGLVRGHKFDLILRSRHPLPAVTRGDLIALFEEANAIGGYKGQLLFQPSTDWTQLLSEQQGRSDNSLKA